MHSQDMIEGLTYVGDEPDMQTLHKIYEEDLSDNFGWFDQCEANRNLRVNWWPGKNREQKKLHVGAKPWRGASDQEVPVVDPRINTLVALCINAIRSGHVTAYPVGSDDVKRASAASTFIRWMIDSWIPHAYEEIELSLNHMFEKGMAATFVGWEKKQRKHLEQFDIQQIAEQAPEAADVLLDENREDEAIALFQSMFESVNERKAKSALKDLRKTGVMKLPVVKGDIDRPAIWDKDPSADVIYPSYTMDTRRVSRCHIRHFMTAQDIEAAVAAEGWDKGWAEDVIDNHMGMTQSEIDGEFSGRLGVQRNQSSSLFNIGSHDAEDLVEIVRTFQRFVDEDGAVGIYQTVWCPKQKESADIPYAIFELLNGWDEFPIAVTTMTRDSKRIYDQRSVCDLLRGNQRQAKVTRDSFVDQQSIAINPPRTHPAGRPASQWGAGADFPTRRGEENLYRTLEIPDTMRQGVEMEQYLDQEADFILGLTLDSPIALARQQYWINRGLAHVSEIARLAYKAYQKYYSDDTIYFRVTGSPDPQTFNRGPMDEEMDIRFSFDARFNDPEFTQKTTEMLVQMKQSNVDGNYSNREIDTIWAHLTVPQFASRIVRPQDAAQRDIVKNVADDLALIWSGQSVGARPEGAQVALQYIQSYVQKDSVRKRMEEDEQFAQDLDTYIQQYEFQLQQAQNAQTGRIGTDPADLQGVNTDQ